MVEILEWLCLKIVKIKRKKPEDSFAISDFQKIQTYYESWNLNSKI